MMKSVKINMMYLGLRNQINDYIPTVMKLNIYLIDFIGVYFDFWGNICGENRGLGAAADCQADKICHFFAIFGNFFRHGALLRRAYA